MCGGVIPVVLGSIWELITPRGVAHLTTAACCYVVAPVVVSAVVVPWLFRVNTGGDATQYQCVGMTDWVG